jgi:hypothetical protein
MPSYQVLDELYLIIVGLELIDVNRLRRGVSETTLLGTARIPRDGFRCSRDYFSRS